MLVQIGSLVGGQLRGYAVISDVRRVRGVERLFSETATARNVMTTNAAKDSELFGKIKQVAGTGAVVVGVGWVSVASLPVAHMQPMRIPTGEFNACPSGDVAELQYVRDPRDPNAFYVCAGGVPQQHRRCRSGFILNMHRTPPVCLQFTNPYKP
ncbi:hypothetical protein MBRA_29840 [Mycobacterium branderi]|uniref:Uncharacterized protein n=1 Tax=Mycobacterium branderi TaxID=43348 RepID=A0ABM7KP60_9MYCO|nr:hypothetical protein MBRA_29840 [Mycobacterium branderi]